jgi:hypothetical protein
LASHNAREGIFTVVNRNPIEQHRLLWISGRPILTVADRVLIKRIDGHHQLLNQGSVMAYGQFNLWRH